MKKDHPYTPPRMSDAPVPLIVFTGVGAPVCTICGEPWANHLDGRTRRGRRGK